MKKSGLVPLFLFLFLLPSKGLGKAVEKPMPAPLARGDRLAYQMEARFEGEACVGTRADYFSREMLLEPLGDGGYLLHFHGALPEMVGVAPLSETVWEEGQLRSTVEERYTSHSLGWITADAEYLFRFSEDGEKIEGSVVIEMGAEPITDKQRETGAHHAISRGLPCRVEGRLTGARTRLPTENLEKEMAIWRLMKEHLDYLTSRETDKAMAPLVKALAIEGDHHVEIEWRVSRLQFLLGERKEKEDKAGRLLAFDKGVEAARRALASDPNRGEASFFLAVNQGRKNTTEGFLKQVFGLEDFEANCLKAIEDKAATEMMGFKVMGDAHFAMGTFYRLVPDSWLAEMVLGTRGDIDKSIDHFRKAVALQPIRGDYLKGLGVSLVCKGVEEEDKKTQAEGMGWLAKSLETPIWAVKPEKEYEHVKRLMANPEDTCKYSRDQY